MGDLLIDTEKLSLGEVFTSERAGSDEKGDGSEQNPYKSALHALLQYKKEPFPTIFVDGKDDQRWQVISQSQLKKLKKLWTREQHKGSSKEKKEAEDAERRKKNIEKAKEIKLEKIDSPFETIKIKDVTSFLEKRVRIFGWVHRLRRQGKALMFITLRESHEYLQCVLTDLLCQTQDALLLNTEASICLMGTIKKAPEGKEAPHGVELVADYWELIRNAPPGGVETVLNEESGVDVQLEQRHLLHRGETLTKIMTVKSWALHCLRQHFLERGYVEVVPPSFVEGQVEGGATLFHLDYFGQKVNLTQSSQLYLETLIPSLGDVYCIEKSFRAEQSRTRRHLTEFQHVEAECPFITYEDLLDRIEDLLVDVVDRILKSPVAHLIKEMNPDFKPPKKPFLRMDYSKAIEYLKEHDIKKEDGTYYEFGEDIPEMPERKMTDQINQIIMLCRFPAGIKSFYMSKCPEDVRLTESVDVLVPGVGEIVGGSMRIWDLEELDQGYARESINADDYYWYTDQRKYGSCPHGGYGLGFERFLTWLLNRNHIRDIPTYPRFVDRFKP